MYTYAYYSRERKNSRMFTIRVNAHVHTFTIPRECTFTPIFTIRVNANVRICFQYAWMQKPTNVCITRERMCNYVYSTRERTFKYVYNTRERTCKHFTIRVNAYT